MLCFVVISLAVTLLLSLLHVVYISPEYDPILNQSVSDLDPGSIDAR